VNASSTTSTAQPVHEATQPIRTPEWSRRLFLPAASQVLPNAMARQLGIVEGRHRLGIFLLACTLLGLIIPTEIAYDAEMWVSRSILGVPPHYVLTALTIALAVLVDIRYYQRYITRPIVAVSIFILMMLLAIGVLRYGLRSYLVRSDIYIIRWFFVGFALMRLAIVSGMLRPYLVFAAVVLVLTAFNIDAKNTLGGEIDTATKRVTSSNLWPVINCGTIMTGLLLTVTWPRSFRLSVFSAMAFGIVVFLGGIRTSTRSLFVAQAICLVLILLALSRDPRMRGRGAGLRRAATAIATIGAVFLIYQVAVGGLLSNFTSLAGRIRQTSMNLEDTGYGRVAEAVGMVEELEPAEWIIGKGLGGMFYSKLGYWTNVPHIAVLGFLQKGGLLIFALVLVTVYIAPSLAFVRELMRPRCSSPLPAPILLVGPMLVSWCLLTFVSGGVDIGSFLGLGGLAALWAQLADDDRVFQANQRRFASPPPVPLTSTPVFQTLGVT
jgi:hypothetical protein